MRRAIPVVALVASLLLFSASGASAASLDPVGNFEGPIFITSDPEDPDRLFVVEREGRVMLVDGSGVSLYADLEALVSCCSGERGLLSIAPAPDFATSGRFYAAYTGKPAAGGTEGDIHVDAFRAVAGGGPPTREPIISTGHDDFANHNGGQIQFGPDGYLYISTGDGGGGGDPLGSGQNLDTLLGKVLRIDPRPGAVPPYEIPPGNPFTGGPGLDEIWSYGLRNPWRFSFDRASGDMAIADVGQGAREEIDYVHSPALGVVGGGGDNYGWNCREGLIAYSGAPESCGGASGFTDPVFDYPHADPGEGKAHGCSITGGYVVRDPSLGGLYGRYLYADFCVGEIRSLLPPAAPGAPASGDRSEGFSVSNPTSFGEDSCGRLYVASNAGQVYRVVGDELADCSQEPEPEPEPEPSPQPDPAPTPAPLPPPSSQLGSESGLPAMGALSRPTRVEATAPNLIAGDYFRVSIVVRVTPCVGNTGGRVLLNRGGLPFAAKRLSDRCIARFSLRIVRRSTFRALLFSSGATEPSRSPRLVVRPDGLG